MTHHCQRAKGTTQGSSLLYDELGFAIEATEVVSAERAKVQVNDIEEKIALDTAMELVIAGIEDIF